MVRQVITAVVVCLFLANAAGATPQYKVVFLRHDYPVGAYGIVDGQQAGVAGSHAALWSGTAESYVDLSPTGFDAAAAYGISGNQQVGHGVGTITGGGQHALLWSGTAESYVDLNPAGFAESWAYGVSDGRQVGYGWGPTTGWYYHALLWSGTAESCMDLNPSEFIDSWAYGIANGQQVGCGMFYRIGIVHALLWSGTPESYVDLHPPSGFTNSGAWGTSGSQQVGYGIGIATGGYQHALLWSGTPESYVDLHPAGFFESFALGVCGGRQVGWGHNYTPRYHALLWSGTADSCVDLHAFLPPTYSNSQAVGIDAAGNIVGNADYSAVMWIPDVPSTPPTIVSIGAPLDPVQVNTVVVVDGSFSDPDAGDIHTALWDWGDGASTVGVVVEEAKTVSGNHIYTTAGIYTLTLTVTDAYGESDGDVFQYVVAYDPAAGFVTGGGWIDSLAGAYIPDSTLAGRAHFGFVAKYQKGSTVPTGDTEFRFKTADLDFRSDTYDWLVVTGSDYAKFKGIGTINGSGDYKFQIWAGDGPDTFRIRIWEENETTGVETDIYDNGFDQGIGGGSIVIHTK